MPWGDDYILALRSAMVAEEIARLVAGAIKREFGEPVDLYWEGQP